MRHKHANRIDMRFKYTPASKTNVAATIAREKKRLAELDRQQADAAAERRGVGPAKRSFVRSHTTDVFCGRRRHRRGKQ